MAIIFPQPGEYFAPLDEICFTLRQKESGASLFAKVVAGTVGGRGVDTPPNVLFGFNFLEH